jgi:hypothetical protein
MEKAMSIDTALSKYYLSFFLLRVIAAVAIEPAIPNNPLVITNTSFLRIIPENNKATLNIQPINITSVKLL